MEKFFTGRTIDEALEAASKELGVSKDSFSYEIAELPKKGFLGIGSSPAKISVRYEVSAEDKVEEYLTGLFGVIGLDGCRTSITVENDHINIQIDGDSAEIFLKKQGEAIEALQMILALTLNRDNDNKYKVTLNINNYREQSKERLEALALRVAKQVAKSKRRVTLNPMSAYQRRIIHSKLQDEPDITTFSIGEEPNRKVVIAYQGADAVNDRPPRKPQGDRPQKTGNQNGFRKNTNKPFNNDRNNNAPKQEAFKSEKFNAKPQAPVAAVDPSQIKVVEGEKRNPNPNAVPAEPKERREREGGYNKNRGERSSYGNKKPYNDRPRQPRSDRPAPDTAAPTNTTPTVSLRDGEKRAPKKEQ